jgi:hypothetical protein
MDTSKDSWDILYEDGEWICGTWKEPGYPSLEIWHSTCGRIMSPPYSTLCENENCEATIPECILEWANNALPFVNLMHPPDRRR